MGRTVLVGREKRLASKSKRIVMERKEGAWREKSRGASPKPPEKYERVLDWCVMKLVDGFANGGFRGLREALPAVLLAYVSWREEATAYWKAKDDARLRAGARKGVKK